MTAPSMRQPPGDDARRPEAAQALVIAVLGAESTGKTWLAQALSEHLRLATGLRCTWVPEWLRQWCRAQGRTPRQHEQALIAQTQQAHIAQAARAHDIVVADTTALMTAVYSLQVFGDETLRKEAVQHHRRVDLTLVTGLDLPWVPDGHQRDGPHVRGPLAATVVRWLQDAGLPFSRVSGQGAARLQSALQACAPALARQRERLGRAP
ncbi:MAG: AAA family ATPase [Rubrivivax sp.]